MIPPIKRNECSEVWSLWILSNCRLCIVVVVIKRCRWLVVRRFAVE